MRSISGESGCDLFVAQIMAPMAFLSLSVSETMLLPISLGLAFPMASMADVAIVIAERAFRLADDANDATKAKTPIPTSATITMPYTNFAILCDGAGLQAFGWVLVETGASLCFDMTIMVGLIDCLNEGTIIALPQPGHSTCIPTQSISASRCCPQCGQENLKVALAITTTFPSDRGRSGYDPCRRPWRARRSRLC